MKAKVLVEGLELHAYHGWHPHEGEFGQPYAIDIELLTDVGRAASSDHLSHALDYQVIVETTKGLFIGTRHKLVERAGVELARGLMTRFPDVQEVMVRVRKLKPPIPERIFAVGVELRLTRDEFARGD